MLRCTVLAALLASAFTSALALSTLPEDANSMAGLKMQVTSSSTFKDKINDVCAKAKGSTGVHDSHCRTAATDALFCRLMTRSRPDLSKEACGGGAAGAASFVQLRARTSKRVAVRAVAPEDELAKEMTHDLEMNFNKIAPFGKEDTAKELQDHAAKTQDTLVDAVENAEVAEIKRAVFRALTRLRAATIKEFDTIARLETQAIDAYNDAHHYRAENPLAHLHEDEAPVETDKLKSFH